MSRTEFDSCDQYSMAAEKDSGRSDVSDMGSDNVSLADEEQQTPREFLGHRSLRTAALSLKLLRNQEADQQSARLFVQALAAMLPRLLGPHTATEVDLSLQNFSFSFCSGLQAGETCVCVCVPFFPKHFVLRFRTKKELISLLLI